MIVAFYAISMILAIDYNNAMINYNNSLAQNLPQFKDHNDTFKLVAIMEFVAKTFLAIGIGVIIWTLACVLEKKK